MSIFAVNGDFTSTFVFDFWSPVYYPCKDFPSGYLASFKTLGEGICTKVFGNVNISDR